VLTHPSARKSEAAKEIALCKEALAKQQNEEGRHQ